MAASAASNQPHHLIGLSVGYVSLGLFRASLHTSPTCLVAA
ncbi:hypothetical protein N836_21365 [Leptolyngbya sp. Heron Island J]|nr:hypothetical protein N836_21365 [Leptolyngbya sp. Heron Island J]